MRNFKEICKMRMFGFNMQNIFKLSRRIASLGVVDKIKHLSLFPLR